MKGELSKIVTLAGRLVNTGASFTGSIFTVTVADGEVAKPSLTVKSNEAYGEPLAFVAGAKMTRRCESVTAVPAAVIGAPRVTPSDV